MRSPLLCLVGAGILVCGSLLDSTLILIAGGFVVGYGFSKLE